MALWQTTAKVTKGKYLFLLLLLGAYTCMYLLKRINYILVRLSQNLRCFELFIPSLELASNLHYDMAVLARMGISSPRTNSVHQRTLSPKASEYRDIYDFNLKVVYNSKTPLSASPNLLIASITSSSSAIANVARKNISDC